MSSLRIFPIVSNVLSTALLSVVSVFGAVSFSSICFLMSAGAVSRKKSGRSEVPASQKHKHYIQLYYSQSHHMIRDKEVFLY